MIVKIPLDGGLVTQVDPDDIGASACTELVNLELDKPGLIYKRKGFGEGFNVFPAQKVYSQNAELVDMVRWYNKNIPGGYYWISTFRTYSNGAHHLSYWYSVDGSSWTAINAVDESSDVITTDLSQVGTSGLMATIKDFNNQLRFVNGLSIDSQVYQYIDRGYFWGAYPGHANHPDVSYKEFVLDSTMPKDSMADIMSVSLASSTFAEEGDWFYQSNAIGYDLSSTKYYYKYSVVFDGLQESPLSKNPIAEIGATSVSDKVIPYFDFEIRPGSFESMENFNKRVTAINIYRSTASGGPYAKISSISTLKDDPNTIKGKAFYGSSETVKARVHVNISDSLAKDELVGKKFLNFNKAAMVKGITANTNGGLLEVEPWSTDGQNPVSSDGETDPQGFNPSGPVYTPYGSSSGTQVSSNHWAQWGSEISYRENKREINNTKINNPFRAYIVDSVVAGSGDYNGNLGTNTIDMLGATNSSGSTDTSGMANDQTKDDLGLAIWLPCGTTSVYTTSGGTSTTSNMLTFNTQNLSLEAETDYIFVGWHSGYGGGSGSTTVYIDALDPFGISVGRTEIALFETVSSEDNATGYAGIGHVDARFIQFCLPFKTSTAGNYHFTFKNSMQSSSGADKYYFSGLVVGKQLDKNMEGIAYYGDNFIVGDLKLGSVDSQKGSIYAVSGFSDHLWEQHTERGYIKNNTNNVIRPYVSPGDEPFFPIKSTAASALVGENDVFVNSNYYYLSKQRNEGYPAVDELDKTVLLRFFDKDLTDGPSHSYGQTSIDVKYKYSKYMNGRNYVGNVKISNGSESEEHGNWIMFSELNQPDVIPILNYIQLSDAQGGDIIGVESLLGDLVVFMERGIYRLSIPSADPTAWSLSEAEENIGCAFEDTITPWEAGVFFCAKDHIYFLDANFQAQPVTKTIQDDYKAIVKGASKKGTKLTYDPGKNKLWFYGTEKEETQDEIYYLDLSVFPKERWAKIKPGSIENTATGHVDTEGTINLPIKKIVIDENLTAGHIGSRIRTQFVPEGFLHQQYINFDSSKGDETLGLQRKTGWISGADLGTRIHVRKLNLKYKGSSFQVKFYADGNSDTVVRNITIPTDTSGEDWYRCVPGIRCRSFMIEIYGSQTDTDREIRRMEIEYE